MSAFFSVRGEKGVKNGTPKDIVPRIREIHKIKQPHIPTIPKKAPAKIKTNLNILKENESEYEGIAKDAIPHIETIIIVIGLTSPALTAD